MFEKKLCKAITKEAARVIKSIALLFSQHIHTQHAEREDNGKREKIDISMRYGNKARRRI